MAYKDPSQLERLVKRLYHPNFDFYIHVDSNTSLAPFQYLEALPNVYFTRKMYPMIWASYRLIEALSLFMEELLASDRNYDFISAFTGQDYPIQPTNYIYDYFSNRLNNSFITLEDQDSPWYKRCESRFKTYHMTYYRFRGRYAIQSLLQLLPPRKMPLFNTIYGGPRASWWTLSAEMARYVVDFLKANPNIVRYCRYTWAPDEFLIPTIIMNSTHRNKVIQNSGRYIDWSNGGSSPKILTTEDLKPLLRSNQLFARKFDINVDTQILNQLDEHFSDKKDISSGSDKSNIKAS
jgi:hypothetical protein